MLCLHMARGLTGSVSLTSMIARVEQKRFTGDVGFIFRFM